MFQVYIRHFNPPVGWGGSGIVEQEHLMYEIPHDYSEGDILIDPKVKTEMGKAGSFEFAMEQNNPWYGSLEQMSTMMRVKFDDETIFFGRVLAIDTDMWGKRSVHCEGALAFLLDTLIIATREDDREKISLETYVKDLIDSHNNLVEENKKFSYGQIPGYYSLGLPSEMKPKTDTQKYGTGSWTSTMNCLEDLTSKYGGYWRCRYGENDGKLYLDWLLNYFDPVVCNQPLRVSENIINMSGTVDVNGIFTAFIPEGTKNGKSLYLDDIPKTIIKVPVKRKKEHIVEPDEEENQGGNS